MQGGKEVQSGQLPADFPFRRRARGHARPLLATSTDPFTPHKKPAQWVGLSSPPFFQLRRQAQRG